MCEMSDKWVREGVKIGEKRGAMKAKKETALKMAQKGTKEDVIAELLDVSESLIKQWLNSGVVLVKQQV